MSLQKTVLTAIIAGAALLGSASFALAQPGFATSNVNVRSGPGTGYRVVDTLRRGEAVDIERCRGSWCFVSKRGPDGWVSANYLSGDDDDYYRPRPPRPPIYYDPRPPRPPHWNRPGRPDWDRPGRPDWNAPPNRPGRAQPPPNPNGPDPRYQGGVCEHLPPGAFCPAL